jgi:hypothetical protein
MVSALDFIQPHSSCAVASIRKRMHFLSFIHPRVYPKADNAGTAHSLGRPSGRGTLRARNQGPAVCRGVAREKGQPRSRV